MAISFIDVKVPSNEINVVVFKDLHYGAVDQDRTSIKRSIKTILDTPNTYGISIGDNLDLATAGSYGVIGVDHSPQDAVDLLAADFRPLAEVGKLLGFVQGNHDTRVLRAIKAKVDLTEILVNEWNEIYGGCIQYGKPAIVARFRTDKTCSFTGVFIHGTGGGRNPGSAANWLPRIRNIAADADFYVQGHHHQPMAMWRNMNLIKSTPFSLQKKTQLFVTVGGAIDDAEYAQTKMLEDCPNYDVMIKMKARLNSKKNKTIDYKWLK